MYTGLYRDSAYLIKHSEIEYFMGRDTLMFKSTLEFTTHIVKAEDTLDYIAYLYYKNPRLWYILAEANHIFNPFELPIGTLLKIPKIRT